MSETLKKIRLQYDGYAKTNLLWKDESLMGIRQFEVKTFDRPILDVAIPENMRLGFRVERFVGSDLNQMKNVEILAENIQIQEKNRTIGEIDCLLKYNGVPIHLEIIYKLYLYDPSVGHSEIEHWIGGNRTDSLIKKLTKLKKKQLPLIYNDNVKHILRSHEIESDAIKQYVHFKAQLFLPYKENIDFSIINRACLKGFYIRTHQLKFFNDCDFFIPDKSDWLVEPHMDVEWMSYSSFTNTIHKRVAHKNYPLCWIRFQNYEMQKMFVVYWD